MTPFCPGHIQLGTFLVWWVTISVIICMLPCFILFLFDLNSLSHWVSYLWFFLVAKILLQNLLVSSVSVFLLLSTFPPRCWCSLFWFCWNSLLILYCWILWSYHLILVTFACSLCFSSSIATFNPFFFLDSVFVFYSWYFSLFLISPHFFHSKFLIWFCGSCIDCCILLFHQNHFTAFPLLLVWDLLFFPERWSML